MSMMDEILRRAQAKKQKVPEGWVKVGERNGKPLYRYTKGDNYIVKATKTAVARATAPTRTAAARLGDLLLLPRENDSHTAGGKCPHCNGAGRYLIHTKRIREKCYRCDGKGVLDERDLAFLERRVQNNEPVCRVAGF